MGQNIVFEPPPPALLINKMTALCCLHLDHKWLSEWLNRTTLQYHSRLDIRRLLSAGLHNDTRCRMGFESYRWLCYRGDIGRHHSRSDYSVRVHLKEKCGPAERKERQKRVDDLINATKFKITSVFLKNIIWAFGT